MDELGISAGRPPETKRDSDLLWELMELADEKGASDIHLAPNRHPAFRIDSVMRRQEQYPVLEPAECEHLLYSILPDKQRLALDRDWEIDLSYDLRISGRPVRFRINMHRQQQGLGAVFRVIPDKMPTPESIGLEECVVKLTELPRGLVLVTGPTGCGKTTTLACMLELINQRDNKHILTIEDPIELVYREKTCVITQRELNSHTKEFARALKSALRSDPDVILVGEMRDLETISLALTAAETGHLVFATLHTTDASQTVDRVIDVFPSAQQGMVRSQLSSVLEAVVSQVLLPRVKGGRIAAREILLASTAVRTLIREQQTQKIYATMGMGVREGMCPLELSLARLLYNGDIAAEAAKGACSRNRERALDDYLQGVSQKALDEGKGAASPSGGRNTRRPRWRR